jgi:hypothetical protein
MTRKPLSVEEIIASLEAQAAVHREREAFFAAQEALFREQRERHAAELATITRRLEAFRDSAVAAAELAERTFESAEAEEDFGPASKPRLARMVRRVVSDLGPDRAFGANAVAREINSRYGSNLRKPVDVHQISSVLRRMHRLGELDLHRPGTARREARYALKKRP